MSREVPQRDEGPTVSSLHGADPGGCQSPSASVPPETPGPLAVAVCPNLPDSGVLARSDAGRLRHTYPGDMGKRFSTETIYAALYVLPRGALRSELLAALRRRGRIDGAKFPI